MKLNLDIFTILIQIQENTSQMEVKMVRKFVCIYKGCVIRVNFIAVASQQIITWRNGMCHMNPLFSPLDFDVNSFRYFKFC